MGFAWTDGFDSYLIGSDLSKNYAVVGAGWTVNTSGGRTGLGAAVGSGASATILQSTQIIPDPSGGYFDAGFYMKVTGGNPASAAIIFQTYTSSLLVVANVTLNTNGTLTVAYANSSITSTLTVTDGAYHWIEFYMYYSGGTVNTALYIDNISQGNNSNFAVPNTNVDHFIFQSIPNRTLTIDDAVCYNNSTGTPNNGSFPISARQITTLRPTTDGAVNFSTVVGGTGTHASAVNEQTADGDTSYVNDGTSGHQDLYNYALLGYSPVNITGVMVHSYLKDPSAGSINFQTVCKSGATTSLGLSTVTPGIYQMMQTPFPTDPNTSAAWTQAGINAAQFGIKVP